MKRGKKKSGSKLPKNGICTITGEPDYIPDSYTGNIRFPGDMAKIFCVTPDKLDDMPRVRAGYRASQKNNTYFAVIFCYLGGAERDTAGEYCDRTKIRRIHT